MDLTGGAGEEIDMASPASKIDIAKGILWRKLLHFKEQNFLLCAGSPTGAEGLSDDYVSAAGIVQKHAYSIQRVRKAGLVSRVSSVSGFLFWCSFGSVA